MEPLQLIVTNDAHRLEESEQTNLSSVVALSHVEIEQFAEIWAILIKDLTEILGKVLLFEINLSFVKSIWLLREQL